MYIPPHQPQIKIFARVEVDMKTLQLQSSASNGGLCFLRCRGRPIASTASSAALHALDVPAAFSLLLYGLSASFKDNDARSIKPFQGPFATVFIVRPTGLPSRPTDRSQASNAC